jgi:hypothetical protein
MLDEVSIPVENEISEELLTELQPAEGMDFSSFTKPDFQKFTDKFLKTDDLASEYNNFKKAKPFVENLFEEEKHQALEKFTADGSSADDFEFHGDPFYEKFEKLHQKAKTLSQQNHKDYIVKKETNYKTKLDLLDKMRTLAEGTAGKNAFEKFKAFQLEWKNTGAVPAEKANELWSSYHAVCNRFYDNRSIAFELLDLDRKRNLQAKLMLCDKAEALINEQSVKKSLNGLEELHEEFRHIGPVPREQQEEIWNRLKAASDKIHEKKKAYLEELKSKQEGNITKKQELLDKLKTYAEFQSLIPGEWAAKTKELDAIQVEWKSTGLIDKDKVREVNRQYWDTLKLFYNNKRLFFKGLEGEKNENLKKKTGLCEKAEAFINSESPDAMQQIINLQKDWKSIGHVPLKFKDKIYDRFKKACDGYFENKRSAQKQQQEVAKGQLKGKIEFVENLEKVDSKTIKSVADVNKYLEEWKALPESEGSEYSKVYNRYAEAIKSKLKDVTDADVIQKDELVSKLYAEALKHHPDYEKEVQFREKKMRKDIRDIEDNIAQYNNNMEFFARAKNADAIRKEFTDKVAEEQNKLKMLKSRLKILLAK